MKTFTISLVLSMTLIFRLFGAINQQDIDYMLPSSQIIDTTYFCLIEPDELTIDEQACFSLYVNNFVLIQTFQFSIDFDPKVLVFKEVKNLNEELMITINDFNEPFIGNLRVSWIDLTGKGHTLDNGVLVAEICFDVLNTTPTNDYIQLGGNLPGGFESTNIEDQIIPIGFTCNFISSTTSAALTAFGISPNPSHDILEFELLSRIDYVNIIDINGMVYRKNITKSDVTNNRCELDISDLPSGNYILQLSSGEQSKFVKI